MPGKRITTQRTDFRSIYITYKRVCYVHVRVRACVWECVSVWEGVREICVHDHVRVSFILKQRLSLRAGLICTRRKKAQPHCVLCLNYNRQHQQCFNGVKGNINEKRKEYKSG